MNEFQPILTFCRVLGSVSASGARRKYDRQVAGLSLVRMYQYREYSYLLDGTKN